MALFEIGDVIRFTYMGSASRAGSTSIYKEILVLHTNWGGKVHAIDLKRLTAAERETIKVVMDPESKGKGHRFPLVTDILTRMDPPTLILEPVQFYIQFVKPFIRNKDVYRTYFSRKMSGVQRIDIKKISSVFSTGTKPLFGS